MGYLGKPMAEEEVTASEEVEEPVAATEIAESESETEQTEQETQPEETVEKVYTKAEVDEIMTKRIAREKRRLQRENDANQQKPEPEGEIKLEDFDSTEDYLIAKARVAAREEFRLEQQKAEAHKLVKAWEKRQEAARRKYDDFDDALADVDHIGLPKYTQRAIAESDLSGDVSYYLAKHPDELERISDLSEAAALRAIGRIEAKLESAPAPKQVSKAPPPHKGLTGSKPRASEPVIKDGMAPEEFMRVRNIQLGRSN
jgi:hypothetical protein